VQFVDASAKHFQSLYINHWPMIFPLLQQSHEFLSLVSISDGDICKAIKRLKPFKSVGLDDISGIVIKGCSDIFIPIHKHILNLIQAPSYFPASRWKEIAIVPRGNLAAMSNDFSMLGGSRHYSMARPRVADGVSASSCCTLNKQPRINDKGLSSSLGVGHGANNPLQ
jgi:hypothetical protein